MSLTKKSDKSVGELKDQMNVNKLKAVVEAEQVGRVTEFSKKLTALKKEFNCELFCKRIEVGIGANIQIQYGIVIQANPAQ